jgi:hypothetical protein
MLMFSYSTGRSQVDTTFALSLKTKKAIVFSTQGALVVGSLFYLQSAWYADFKTQDFHVIDDSGQWLQMDKIGHIATVNILSKLNYDAYRWAGYTNKQAVWMGVGLSWGYLAAVEIMDGYSAGWGYSWSDMAANTIGAAVFAAQQLTWKDQRFILKYSFHQTEYADMRPSILGSSAAEKLLKDYNGQTYWLSVNPQSFSKDRKIFPPWLNLALGYSGDGMLGGSSNVGEGYDFSEIPRIRQFYFAPDIDFTRIKTKNPFFKAFFAILNIIKVPAPTLEVDQNGNVQFYWLYF